MQKSLSLPPNPKPTATEKYLQGKAMVDEALNNLTSEIGSEKILHNNNNQ